MTSHDILQRGDEDDDPRDTPRSYAQGYMRGLYEYWKLLTQHGAYDYINIYEHCANLYDALVEWETRDENDSPPELPPYSH